MKVERILIVYAIVEAFLVEEASKVARDMISSDGTPNKSSKRSKESQSKKASKKPSPRQRKDSSEKSPKKQRAEQSERPKEPRKLSTREKTETVLEAREEEASRQVEDSRTSEERLASNIRPGGPQSTVERSDIDTSMEGHDEQPTAAQASKPEGKGKKKKRSKKDSGSEPIVQSSDTQTTSTGVQATGDEVLRKKVKKLLGHLVEFDFDQLLRDAADGEYVEPKKTISPIKLSDYKDSEIFAKQNEFPVDFDFHADEILGQIPGLALSLFEQLLRVLIHRGV